VETDDDDTIMFGLTAASEDDVKALLHLHVLQGVTQVARHRNLGKGKVVLSATDVNGGHASPFPPMPDWYRHPRE
jgi:hypothetical protein